MSSFYIHPRASFYSDSYLLKLQNYFEETNNFLCKTTEDMSLLHLGSASPTTERLPQMKALWNRAIFSNKVESGLNPLSQRCHASIYIQESLTHGPQETRTGMAVAAFFPESQRWKTALVSLGSRRGKSQCIPIKTRYWSEKMTAPQRRACMQINLKNKKWWTKKRKSQGTTWCDFVNKKCKNCPQSIHRSGMYT